MTDINKIVLVGRLTKDAQLKYTAGGTAIANFSIANNQSRKQGDEWKEEVNYFDIRLWGRRGESLNQYLTKGKQVIVSGRLKQERWVKQEQSHSKIIIDCEDIQLVNSGNNKQSQSNNATPTYNNDLNDIPF